MKRYAASAEAAPQQQAPTGADSVLTALISATIALAVCGGVALAAGWIEVSGLRVVGLLAVVAWGGAFVMLVAASWGRAWCVLESATGRDLDRSGDVGDGGVDRLLPVNAGGRPVGPVGEDKPAMSREDLAYMIGQIDVRGYSVRAWLGQRLPSGYTIQSAEDGPYCAFIEILERHGWLVDRKERSAGRLTRTPDEIRAALREAGVL